MKTLIISFIHTYQFIKGIFNVRTCRFYPTCSEYMIEAINKKGVGKGIIQGTYRILRCNPFNSGGYDPVK